MIKEFRIKPFHFQITFLSILFFFITSCKSVDQREYSIEKTPESKTEKKEDHKHYDEPLSKESSELNLIEKAIPTTDPMSISLVEDAASAVLSKGFEGTVGTRSNPVSVDIKPGQITAAEWNDLNNWEDWNSLLEDQNYKEMQEFWKLYSHERYSVFVMNEYEIPLHDIRIELIGKEDEILWTARTDNSGNAELWANFNGNKKNNEGLKLKIYSSNGPSSEVGAVSIHEGVNTIRLNKECKLNENVDVMFVVDATGSMGDEIHFLQSELEDVINRSSNSNPKINLRTGSVFYRDYQDEYVTRTTPLGEDAKRTLDFIKNQSAQGGGDYPEAVERALDDALAQDWSEHAIAKILFLVLDAPPHHSDSIILRIQEQIKDAAEEGIKIIPITASGINRQTEFLMKFMSILTNGTYVFITDHSGIGNPHLDPVVEDYEVEKLNDLIVRLLYYYTRSNGCNSNDPVESSVSMYPNPTSNYINIKSTVALDNIRVLSSSGRTLIMLASPQQKDIKVELGSLTDGIYTIQCFGKGFEYSQPVIVVSE